jgi:prephenate dehydratase
MISYLGPEGSFCDMALRSLDLDDPALGLAATAGRDPAPSVPQALARVRDGQAAAAMVPLENSVEGAVTRTVDELADLDAAPLQVVREVLLAVRFALLARPGTQLAAVASVATHPHAQAQCRRWLAERLPHAQLTLAASTSEAARMVAAGELDAAVAAPLAAERYGLALLADDIADSPGAVTRFVLVRRPGPLPAWTGADRTSVVAYIADDRPGALLELLTEYAVRGVNLTRIESRPTGRELGRYCFSLDCEGHLDDARVAEALSGLRRGCAAVRFLGSYPRGDARPAQVRAGTSSADFAAAAAWVAGLRNQTRDDAAPTAVKG